MKKSDIFYVLAVAFGWLTFWAFIVRVLIGHVE